MRDPSLEAEFTQALRRLNDEARSASPNYRGEIFDEMLGRHRGWKTAHLLVRSGDLQAGFREMIRVNRPDLTVEHLMLSERYRSLFSQEDLEASQWRLNQAHSPQ